MSAHKPIHDFFQRTEDDIQTTEEEESGCAPTPIPADPAYQLAMLCLQSDRYGSDPDFRDATDAVLGWVKAARRHNPNPL